MDLQEKGPAEWDRSFLLIYFWKLKSAHFALQYIPFTMSKSAQEIVLLKLLSAKTIIQLDLQGPSLKWSVLL